MVSERMLENVAGREPQFALFLHVRFPFLSDDLLTSRTAGEIPKVVQFGRHERERVGTECIVAMDSPRVATHGGALIALITITFLSVYAMNSRALCHPQKGQKSSRT